MVGTVSAALHAESERIYKWLQQTGEVDRLKRLDHLGAVRLAWEGAHHPRWEYIAFIVALIDRCRDHVPESHLGTKVKLAKSTEVSSGSELLKSWALLLYVGHVQWTFFAERVFMLELWGRRTQRAELLGLFAPDAQLQNWATTTLQRGDIYRFFQILAFVRLGYLGEQHQTDIPLRQILRAFVLENDSPPGVSRLRELYRRLRRVAYMALDAHYTPAVLQLDATQLFSDPFTLADWLVPPRAASGDPLAVIEGYLSENIYLAEPVIRAMTAREQGLRKTIRDSLSADDGLRKTIEALAKGELQERVGLREVDTVVRLFISAEPPFERGFLKIPNPRKEENRLQSQLPEDARYDSLVSFWPSVDGNSWVAQLHAPSGDRAARVMVYCVAFDYVARLRENAEPWAEWLGEDGLQELLFERLALELIIRALELVGDTGLQLRWELVASFARPLAVIASRRNARALIKKQMRNALPNDEKAELQGKLLLLRDRPKDCVAMSIGRLEAYKGREKFCELDGCMVGVKGKRVTVTIIEVKSGKKTSEARARKDLRQKLDKLGHSSEPRSKTERKVVIAWAAIEFAPNNVNLEEKRMSDNP